MSQSDSANQGLRSYAESVEHDHRQSRRNQRAIVVAELLRMGYDPQKVSEALKITDAGGSVCDAMEALR